MSEERKGGGVRKVVACPTGITAGKLNWQSFPNAARDIATDLPLEAPDTLPTVAAQMRTHNLVFRTRIIATIGI